MACVCGTHHSITTRAVSGRHARAAISSGAAAGRPAPLAWRSRFERALGQVRNARCVFNVTVGSSETPGVAARRRREPRSTTNRCCSGAQASLGHTRGNHQVILAGPWGARPSTVARGVRGNPWWRRRPAASPAPRPPAAPPATIYNHVSRCPRLADPVILRIICGNLSRSCREDSRDACGGCGAAGRSWQRRPTVAAMAR